MGSPERSGRFLPGDQRVEGPYRLTPQMALRVAVLGFLACAADLLRYSAEPRLAQEKTSPKASAECSTMLATLSWASFARATDFSNRSTNEVGISGRSVPTAGLSAAGAAEGRLLLDVLV